MGSVVAMLPASLALVLAFAAHRPAATAWFLAADPHVPLAEVVGGRIHEAVEPAARGRCGSPARWAKLGSKWRALDAWGQIVSTRVASAKDDYDVTGCAELSFTPKARTDRVSVLVSADSVWQSPPSAEWMPTRIERSSFDALVAKQIPDTSVRATLIPSQCTAIPTRTRFFDVPGRGHFAVGTSNAGYLIARYDPRRSSGWTVLTRERSRVTTFGAFCYRPVAVFDMNADGVPEIILRESEGASWGESIFELSPDGMWKETVGSPGGATA